MSEYTAIGKSFVRKDAISKVIGKEMFCSDIKLPGMLHMKVLGSSYPHARIVHVDTTEAEKLRDVVCIVTEKDAPERLVGSMTVKDMPILAKDVARYVGEPIAAVAAKSIEAAEDAIELIKVDYEELPAVFDVEESAKERPPVVIHPNFSQYRIMIPPQRLCPERPNVFTHVKVRRGDVEKGFLESDIIVENRFVAPALHHAALERHSVVVRPEPEGGLTIFTGKQAIWRVKGDVAAFFGIDPSKVRVVQKYVGGSFGGKVGLYEYIPALLALKTGRPIKYVMTREEIFYSGGLREGMVIYVKDGYKKDGTMMARQMEVYVDGGAYAEATPVITKNCSSAVVCMYKTKHLKWDGYGVYTNTPKRNGMRGFGVNEIVFAMEANIDIAAEKLGMDPCDLRRKNLLKEGEPMLNGEIAHSIGAEECLKQVLRAKAEVASAPSKGPWKTGWGFSLGNKYSTAPAHSGARVKVTENEKVIIYHSADAVGMGVNTVMAQVVAEEFGISVDDVEVVFSDTASTPFFGNGSTSSRTTYNLGNAFRAACRKAKEEIVELAAKNLDTPPELLRYERMEVISNADPEKRVRVSALFAPYQNRPPKMFSGLAGGKSEIMGTASYMTDCISDHPETCQLDPDLARLGKRLNAFYSYVAKAVEVAVNVETGQVRVLRCFGAVDLGKAINPKLCEQQSEGGMVMGIGSALYEEALIKDGLIVNPNFTDYRVPLAPQLPSNDNVKSILVESTPHSDGPFGAKGFSEGVVAGTEPAIANAVYNAVGFRINELPLNAERIYAAIKSGKSSK